MTPNNSPFKIGDRVVAYCRYSGGEEQGLKDTSTDEQEAAIRQFCEQNNLNLVKVYADPFVSGRSTKGRDHYLEMMSDLLHAKRKKTGIEGLIAWDFERVHRNYDQAQLDAARLRNRIGEEWGLKRKNAYGNGVSILLYGPPGTGKTMAAQVIANELSLPLYRVDIFQISSKYIGETEKNLGVIFDAAAKANVILFFDEADALFSKRTSVGDSHDKYANSETAYLLQKIEEYDGMSILSTNYYNNFDDAFVRRITYSVHLQQPDKETRYTLWTTILPKTAKIDKNVDFKFLADKFDLSGSNIKAILFNAAYMAGAEEKPVGMKHIVRAMEFEFNKLGKLVNNSDFGDYDIYLQTVEPKKRTPEKTRRTTGTRKRSL